MSKISIIEKRDKLAEETWKSFQKHCSDHGQTLGHGLLHMMDEIEELKDKYNRLLNRVKDAIR